MHIVCSTHYTYYSFALFLLNFFLTPSHTFVSPVKTTVENMSYRTKYLYSELERQRARERLRLRLHRCSKICSGSRSKVRSKKRENTLSNNNNKNKKPTDRLFWLGSGPNVLQIQAPAPFPTKKTDSSGAGSLRTISRKRCEGRKRGGERERERGER